MSTWQKILSGNFRNWKTVADFLEIDPASISSNAKFPLNLPRRLAEKICKGRLDDPILKQFLPLPAEEIETPGYKADPLGESSAAVTPRLLRKYTGRALMTASACAMHCRYCFRRDFEYAKGPTDYAEELAIVQRDTTITELILSGGDPLILPDSRLHAIIKQINEISHLRLLRFHSRFPIGIPERIDESFLALLKEVRPQVWFVIHCNHPRELDVDVLAALGQIQRLGIPVLNQFVLLKGINDTVETLSDLLMTLASHGIQPYYLHALDPVQGVAHFHVSNKKGLALMKALRAQLPGYAVPRFVQELSGASSKVPLHAGNCTKPE